MSRRLLSTRSLDMLSALGVAAMLLWLCLARDKLRECCSNAALTVTGYLRPRPDPAVERALRAAFAELDKELAAVLNARETNDVRDR